MLAFIKQKCLSLVPITIGHVQAPKKSLDPYAAGPPPVARIDFLGRQPLTRPPSQNTIPEISSLDSNAQSPLAVFPLEIRQQIWEDVLGGHTFHIGYMKGRLVADYCLSPDDSTCNLSGAKCQIKFTGTIGKGVGGTLSLLLVCRQM